MVATHHYAQPGTYTACLTVWNGPNCASTTCKTIQVSPQINSDSVRELYLSAGSAGSEQTAFLRQFQHPDPGSDLDDQTPERPRGYTHGDPAPEQPHVPVGIPVTTVFVSGRLHLADA